MGQVSVGIESLQTCLASILVLLLAVDLGGKVLVVGCEQASLVLLVVLGLHVIHLRGPT